MHALSLTCALLAVACGPQYAVVGEDGEDDLSQYDGAELRIVSPRPGDLLELETPHPLDAQITLPDGSTIDFDDVAWSTNVDPAWAASGLHVDEAGLAVGVHELTAEVELPNGDRLAHTIGGLRVQSKWAGTYSGLFSADVTAQGYTAPCSGTVLLIVDAYGQAATGDGSCIAGLQGFDIELNFLFDLANNDGALSGSAGVDLFGFFTYDFPATGSLDATNGTLTVDFGGDAFGQLQVDATAELDRVSLDTALP